MPPTQPNGFQNLIELIFAVKNLAQQVEFFHQDLSRRLDEEVRTHQRDISQLLDIVNKNTQAFSTLPITISDRIENLLNRIETEINKQFDATSEAIDKVNKVLEIYTHTTERVIDQTKITALIADVKEERKTIGSSVEVTDRGDIRVYLKHRLLRKLAITIVAIATSGGAYSFVKMIQNLLNK